MRRAIDNWRPALIGFVVLFVLSAFLITNRLEADKAEELAGHRACAPQRLVKVIDGFAVCETPDPWPERKVVPLKRTQH